MNEKLEAEMASFRALNSHQQVSAKQKIELNMFKVLKIIQMHKIT